MMNNELPRTYVPFTEWAEPSKQTEYTEPTPLLKPDGTRVTPEEWPEYKKGIRDMVVDIGFGGMPPRPEVVEFELRNKFRRADLMLFM